MAKTRLQVMLNDENIALLREQGDGSVSTGIYIVCKAFTAQMDADPNVQKKKRKAEDAEEEATKPGKIEQRHKRQADESYARYYKNVLAKQLEEYAALAKKIYTTFNTREEWDERGGAYPGTQPDNWPDRYARCVRHPDLTDEMRDEAIEAGRARVREYEAKMKASDDAERDRLKHTVRPGMPVQLRKVGEFALANLGLSRTPEEWTDEMIAYVVELDYAGQNSLAGAEMYANWKRDNSEMLSRMRAEYPVNG